MADIPFLRSEDEKSTGDSSVLVVKANLKGDIYAVEKVKGNFYSFVKLKTWQGQRTAPVVEGDNVVNQRQANRSKSRDGPSGGKKEWWRSAEAGPQVGEKSMVTKDEVLLPRIDLSRPSNYASQTLGQVQNAADGSGAFKGCDSVTAEPLASANESIEDPVKEPKDILAMIKVQYQEALYVSRVSMSLCSF